MNAATSIKILRAIRRQTFHGGYARSILRKNLCGKVTVLLYHRIAEHDDHSFLEQSGLPDTPPDVFAKHLELLRSIGAVFLTAQDLLDGQYPDENDPGIVITFDDGFRDNFTTATQILNQHDASGVFFVTTSLPNKVPLWDHRLAWLNSLPNASQRMLEVVKQRLENPNVLEQHSPVWYIRNLMRPDDIVTVLEQLESEFDRMPIEVVDQIYGTWEEIQSASADGHEIGAHTQHHWMRHSLTIQQFEDEVRDSKTEIETHTGRACRSFSYPFNSHFLSDEALCRKLGFDTIFTVDPGRINKKSSLGYLPRRTVFCIHDDMKRFIELLLEPGFDE